MSQPRIQVQTWVQLSLFGDTQGPRVTVSVESTASKPSSHKRTA